MRDPTPGAVETKNILPLGLLAAAGFLSVAGARAVDPLLSLMARDFATSVPAMSAMIAAFTMAYGLNQLLLGPLGDRWGKLHVLLGGLVAYAVFTTACAWAGSFASLILLRACAGAASAGLVPVCLAYIGDAVPYDRRQITLSRFATGIVMAQILAGPLGGAVGQVSGWRGVFVLLGAGGFALAAVLSLRLRRLPDRRGRRAPALATWRKLSSRADARLLLGATLIEGALTGGVVPFLGPYLHVRFALPYAAVGLVLACFGLGTFIYTRLARFILPRADEAQLVLAGGAADRRHARRRHDQRRLGRLHPRPGGDRFRLHHDAHRPAITRHRTAARGTRHRRLAVRLRAVRGPGARRAGLRCLRRGLGLSPGVLGRRGWPGSAGLRLVDDDAQLSGHSRANGLTCRHAPRRLLPLSSASRGMPPCRIAASRRSCSPIRAAWTPA